MKFLNGKGISPGYAEGRAVVLRSGDGLAVSRRTIEEVEVEGEHVRFVAALDSVAADLAQSRERLAGRVGQAEAAILDAQTAILRDAQLAASVRESIARDRVNAEWAVEREMDELAGRLQSTSVPYLVERADDVRDLCRRLLLHFSGTSREDLPRLPADSILVADHLLPSDTIQIDRDQVRGILIERCGRTSHAAILAKALGIPAVSDLPDVCSRIRSGSRLLVDGISGEIVIDPDPERRERFAEAQRSYSRTRASAAERAREQCVSRDGVRVEVHANLGRVAEARDVRARGLDGVGLFRTEVLFLGHAAPPSFEEHREAYRRVAEELGGLPLVIRVLDLGGDKRPSFLPRLSQHNPTLGLRGLRFALKEGGMLRTQLQAMLDVAQEHPLKVLFPMVLGGGDLRAAVEVLHDEARRGGYARIPPVGAMVETPSALFALDEVARRVDFLSIGSNDLTQFLLAADRDAAELIDDYSMLHPSVLRAIRLIVTKADAANRPLSVCGEAAGDPVLVPVLLGLGVRQLSMSPARATDVRLAIRGCDVAEEARQVRILLECESLEEIRKRVVERPHPSRRSTQY